MRIATELEKLFDRDLKRLKEEINAYQREEDLWVRKGNIKNPGGNLAMHLCGNLKHFIGAVLSNNDYQRDRDFEFAGQRSKDDLLVEIEETIEVVHSFFVEADEDLLESTYPLEVFGHKMSTFFFLMHLQGHLNYHLGQLNYHRRILSE